MIIGCLGNSRIGDIPYLPPPFFEKDLCAGYAAISTGSEGGGFSATPQAQLAENLADMVFYRFSTNHQASRNLTIGQALGQQRQNFGLSLG